MCFIKRIGELISLYDCNEGEIKNLLSFSVKDN